MNTDISSLHQQYLFCANDSDDLRLASVAEELIQVLATAAGIPLEALVLDEGPAASDIADAQTRGKNAAWLEGEGNPVPEDYFSYTDGVQRVKKSVLTALIAQLRVDLSLIKHFRKAVLLSRVPGRGVNVALKEALAQITGEEPVLLDVPDLGLNPQISTVMARNLSGAKAIIIDNPSMGGENVKNLITKLLDQRQLIVSVKFAGDQKFTLRDDVLIVVSDIQRSEHQGSSFLTDVDKTITLGRVYGKSL